MLTKTQQELVDGIIGEFNNINAKDASKKSDGRFTLASVRKCEHDKEEFIRNMNLHNSAMLSLFREKVLSDINEFTQEFGSVIDVKLCREYADPNMSNHQMLLELKDDWMDKEHRHSPGTTKAKQIKAYFVSKTKTQKVDYKQSRFGEINIGSAMCFVAFITPKADWASIVLEDGTNYRMLKISGTQYSLHDWLRDGDYPSYSSLDEMLQNSKDFQRQIVRIS
jgi:hypothetical protein